MESVDLHAQLLSVRNKEEKLLEEVYQILSTQKSVNAFDFDKLEPNRIFHLDNIRDICIDYRLRFLDISRFKGVVPKAALTQQKAIENTHNTQLSQLKIMAPSKLFKLDSADDPLLFAPMGNDYYYLIHKWGNDMSPLRKAFVWPFKNIITMCVSLLLVSLAITWVMPLHLFNPNPTLSDFLLIFLFVFKSIAAVAIYYAFALGKKL
jgi:ABC-type multidrug transport system fused ATPase/permease subunit